MKKTILLAILTTVLAQAGIYEAAELSYVAAASLAWVHGGSAIALTVQEIKRHARATGPLSPPPPPVA